MKLTPTPYRTIYAFQIKQAIPLQKTNYENIDPPQTLPYNAATTTI
jgi:hypothetical protein